MRTAVLDAASNEAPDLAAPGAAAGPRAAVAPAVTPPAVTPTTVTPTTVRPVAAPAPEAIQPGRLLARGVARHLWSHDFVTLEEFSPAPGLRVDVVALGPRGEIWVVECKSCRADFVSDRKWRGYLEWCDRYFWAVDVDFPADLLPPDTGLILADAHDAEIVRVGPEAKLASARRRKLTHRFARHAARAARGLGDPGLV